jgi:hypothetical protein
VHVSNGLPILVLIMHFIFKTLLEKFFMIKGISGNEFFSFLGSDAVVRSVRNVAQNAKAIKALQLGLFI